MNMMRFFFTLIANSIHKVYSRRNNETIQQQQKVKSSQLFEIELYQILNIPNETDMKPYVSSGRHNESKVKLMFYRSQIVDSRFSFFSSNL